MRRTSAVLLGKASGKISRLLRQGGGTALPGLVAGWLDPSLISHLSSQIPNGSIVVTGTNGKTTTSRLIANFLRQGGYAPIHNRTGSNLMRGLMTTLLGCTDATGRLIVDEKSIGLFEIDEFVMPYAVQDIKPRVVVFNNLFRDQLDRYGEIDSIAERWRQMIGNLSEDTALVLNADDPLIASLAIGSKARVFYFGVNDTTCGQNKLGHAADSKSCSFCGAELSYSLSYFGHLGHYQCPDCEWERPSPDITADLVTFDGFAGSQISVSLPTESKVVRLGLPGLYNVYNSLAAIAATTAIGLPAEAIISGLESFTAAFGRTERVDINGRIVYLALVKNPIGFNEVLRAVFSGKATQNVLFVLNDQIADGRDVSWIWDVDFENYTALAGRVSTSGLRAEDMALRLKYAGLCESSRQALQVERNPRTALYNAVESLPIGETLFVLPTYTAMLTIQDFLAKDGLITPYWERE